MKLSEFLTSYPEVDREAGQELADIAALVQTLDRKGSMKLDIAVEKTGGRVMVHVGTSTKAPKADPEAGLWFLGPDGLSKDDAYQGRMDPVAGEIHTAPYTRED